MSIAAGRAFVTAIRTLTPAELAALGAPLPAGTLAAANAWNKIAAMRTLQLGSDEADDDSETGLSAASQLAELTIAALISYGIATGRLAPADKYEHTAEVVSRAMIGQTANVSEEEAQASWAFMSSPEMSQITFDLNLEGSPFCAAWLRLGTLFAARTFELPCPIADAEGLLPERMRTA
jgi:hypothetical protein